MPRRVSPMATPMTRAWRSLADEAMTAKAGVAHGERGRRIVEVAQRAQATPITVRRAITARVALMRIEDQGVDVPAFVYALPVGVAAAVARWARHDPETAWRHAASYADGTIAFQALIEAERASRTGDRTVTRKKRVQVADDPHAWRGAQLRGLARKHGRAVLPPALDDIPVDGWIYEGKDTPVGVLVIGPMTNFNDYMAHRSKACITALGVARLVGRAVIIVPGDDIAVRYAAWLSDRGVPITEVGVETVMPSRRTARRERPSGAGEQQLETA